MSNSSNRLSNTWYSLDTLRYDNTKDWPMDEYLLSPDESIFLDTVSLKPICTLYARKPLDAIDFKCGLGEGRCKIVLTSHPEHTGKNAGCRAFAQMLSCLSVYVSGIEYIPDSIFVHAQNFSILPRGLLSLLYLSKPSYRSEFINSFTPVHKPKQTSERWQSYEKRIRGLTAEESAGCQKVPPKLFRLKGISDKFDQLYENRTTKQLFIVEAKMSTLGFSEGVSQLIQYYAKARNLPRFDGYQIITRLVYSEDFQTADYVFWSKKLAPSSMDIKFFIKEK